MITLAELIQFCDDADGGATNMVLARTRSHAAALAACRWAWQYRLWPWSRQERIVRTVAPYATGTANVTSGSTAVTFGGAAALPAFDCPALFYVGDLEHPVAARVSGTAVTLAEGFRGATNAAAPYRLVFPSYALPANVETVEGVSWLYGSRLEQQSWEDWFRRRSAAWTAGVLSGGLWTLLAPNPGNPTAGGVPTIAVWPPPSQATDLRVACRIGIDPLIHYEHGQAAVASGSAALTGTNTAWDTAGVPLVGLAAEFPRPPIASQWTAAGVRGIVKTVDSPTGITLAANWTGPAFTAPADGRNNYSLSTVLPFPDSFRSALQSHARASAAVDRGNSDGPDLPLAQALFAEAESRLASAAGRAFGNTERIVPTRPGNSSPMRTAPWGATLE